VGVEIASQVCGPATGRCHARASWRCSPYPHPPTPQPLPVTLSPPRHCPLIPTISTLNTSCRRVPPGSALPNAPTHTGARAPPPGGAARRGGPFTRCRNPGRVPGSRGPSRCPSAQRAPRCPARAPRAGAARRRHPRRGRSGSQRLRKKGGAPGAVEGKGAETWCTQTGVRRGSLCFCCGGAWRQLRRQGDAVVACMRCGSNCQECTIVKKSPPPRPGAHLAAAQPHS
jgi:hypothetical protein